MTGQINTIRESDPLLIRGESDPLLIRRDEYSDSTEIKPERTELPQPITSLSRNKPTHSLFRPRKQKKNLINFRINNSAKAARLERRQSPGETGKLSRHLATQTEKVHNPHKLRKTEAERTEGKTNNKLKKAVTSDDDLPDIQDQEEDTVVLHSNISSDENSETSPVFFDKYNYCGPNLFFSGKLHVNLGQVNQESNRTSLQSSLNCVSKATSNSPSGIRGPANGTIHTVSSEKEDGRSVLPSVGGLAKSSPVLSVPNVTKSPVTSPSAASPGGVVCPHRKISRSPPSSYRPHSPSLSPQSSLSDSLESVLSDSSARAWSDDSEEEGSTRRSPLRRSSLSASSGGSRSRSRSSNYSSSSRRSSSDKSSVSDRSRSRSLSIPIRHGSPSFLERRRITSARKRPIPYKKRSNGRDSSTDSDSDGRYNRSPTNTPSPIREARKHFRRSKKSPSQHWRRPQHPSSQKKPTTPPRSKHSLPLAPMRLSASPPNKHSFSPTLKKHLTKPPSKHSLQPALNRLPTTPSNLHPIPPVPKRPRASPPNERTSMSALKQTPTLPPHNLIIPSNESSPLRPTAARTSGIETQPKTSAVDESSVQRSDLSPMALVDSGDSSPCLSHSSDMSLSS